MLYITGAQIVTLWYSFWKSERQVWNPNSGLVRVAADCLGSVVVHNSVLIPWQITLTHAVAVSSADMLGVTWHVVRGVMQGARRQGM